MTAGLALWTGALTLIAAAAGPAYACEVRLDGALATLKSARFHAAVRPDPGPIAVAKPFAVEIVVCAAGADGLPDQVQVDAHMPAHRHGMNYRPVTTVTAPGRYRADGLFFHMTGTWELVIELRAGSETDRLAAAIEVE